MTNITKFNAMPYFLKGLNKGIFTIEEDEKGQTIMHLLLHRTR
jgi:hypothetical protein